MLDRVSEQDALDEWLGGRHETNLTRATTIA